MLQIISVFLLHGCLAVLISPIRLSPMARMLSDHFTEVNWLWSCMMTDVACFQEGSTKALQYAPDASFSSGTINRQSR